MEFGRVESAEGIDFSLPSERPETLKTLARYKGKTTQSPRVFIGAPIWNFKDWVGKLYPRGTKSTDYLRHYSRQFNTVELNSTHYSLPDVATIEKWAHTVPEGFCFCPKFPQGISHDRRLQQSADLTKQFLMTVQGLGSSLGPCFLQLPPTFAPREWRTLDAYLGQLPPELKVAVEFRYADWFKNGGLHPKTFEILESHGASAVIADVSGRRDVLHMSLTTSWAFVRFMGNELHASDYTRLDEWIARLKTWFDEGLRELYFFAHQPSNITAPELASYLTRGLNRECGWDLRDWVPQDQGTQLDLF